MAEDLTHYFLVMYSFMFWPPYYMIAPKNYLFIYLLFLLLLAPPRIQLAPGPSHAKTGQNINLPHCTVTGFPKPTVSWRKLTGTFPRHRTVLGDGSFTLRTAQKNDSGAYECTAQNTLGKISAVTTLVVWSPPTFITKPPSNVQKFYGEDLSLHCSATGQASISWKRASGAWEAGRMTVQSGTIKISNLKKSDSGSYICEAKLPLYSIETTAVLAVLNVRGKYQD